MSRTHFLHSWTYLDSEHRICSKCGKCELLYHPPPGFFTRRDGTGLEYWADPPSVWKPCLASEMEKDMDERREKSTKEASQQQVSRARAFELLKMGESSQSFKFCRKCGERNRIEANFCRVCGEAFAKRQ